MRTFIIFVGCLTVLAVGRVALSFAVVQKSLQTDAIVREERRVSDQNAELREKVAAAGLARRASAHRGRTSSAWSNATHFSYPKALSARPLSEVAANR